MLIELQSLQQSTLIFFVGRLAGTFNEVGWKKDQSRREKGKIYQRKSVRFMVNSSNV